MDLEKKKLQFKKNDEIVITIEDLGKDGEGIGHVDGYALFVKGALPGEKVLVHLMKLNKNYGFARLVEILEPSKERMTPSPRIDADYSIRVAVRCSIFPTKASLPSRKRK